MKNKFFKIGNKFLGKGKKVFIIAEIGVNHEGDFNKCIKLFKEAKFSGADAVKLQTVDYKKSYVKGTESFKEFKNTDFSNEEFYKLSKIAKSLNLSFFSTPGDLMSVDKCIKYGSQAIKISSGLMTHLPLIEYASKKELPMIISTGMAFDNEIKNAFEATKSNKNVALLKCTSLYPAPDNTINAKAILNLKNKYKVPVGLSDHTLDDLSSCVAVSNGASIIEKHFTLNKKKKGKDHAISLEPKEFKIMCTKIRRVERILGENIIQPTTLERKLRKSRHRSLVANQTIEEDEIFSLKNVGFKRSLTKRVGLKPIYFKKILGTRNKKKLLIDQPIKRINIKKTR